MGGAILAYLLLAVTTSAPQELRRPTATARRVAVFNAMALIVVVAVSAVSRLLTARPFAFFVMGLVATLMYTLLLALLTYLRNRLS